MEYGATRLALTKSIDPGSVTEIEAEELKPIDRAVDINF